MQMAYEQLLNRIAEEAWKFGIGLTPLLPMKQENNVTIYAKLEGFNKFKSVKDRAGFFMLKGAFQSGILDKTKTVIEASSGNTGLAVASISSMLGLPCEIYVSEATSEETKEWIRKAGAKLVEVSDDLSRKGIINIDSAVRKLNERISDDPERYVNLNQYSNSMNTLSHVYTTAPEIVSALMPENKRPDIFVASIGTGGTITGMSQYFRNRADKTITIAAEPVKGHHIQGLKNLKVSKIPDILRERMHFIDGWISVNDGMAEKGVREILKYGYFAGLSSGANYMAARKLAMNLKNCSIVTVFPDSAEKYRNSMVSRGMFSENQFDRNCEDYLAIPEGAITLSQEEIILNS